MSLFGPDQPVSYPAFCYLSAGVGQRCIDVLGVELRGLKLWVGLRIQKFLQRAREERKRKKGGRERGEVGESGEGNRKRKGRERRRKREEEG